jgi:hypothetical protein
MEYILIQFPGTFLLRFIHTKSVSLSCAATQQRGGA